MGKVLIEVSCLYIGLLTICSHKFHDLQELDALYTRRRIKLKSIIDSVQHKQSLRADGENTPGSIGLGKASQLISNNSLLKKRIE